ncbi:MAG: ATP-dependent DNA helicase RecG [Saprospiraceae bacterium]
MEINKSILNTPIEYVKGVGPAKGELFRKEIGIHTIEDLLFNYPYRYVDKSIIYPIKDAPSDGDNIQIQGLLISLEKIKGKNGKYRLSGVLKDGSGFIDLVWFAGVAILEKILLVGTNYIAFGRVIQFNGSKTMTHPEMESPNTSENRSSSNFEPLYSSTETLTARGVDNRFRRKIIKSILDVLTEKDLPEIIPSYITQKLKLMRRIDAIKIIHTPSDLTEKSKAADYIKFEEIFLVQMRVLQSKISKTKLYKSPPITKIGSAFYEFYNNRLSFQLTDAQKRVIKEIRHDLAKETQMNRLLQGDVGSGKTIVALLCMLIIKDNGMQSCIMAPTEILAQQHYNSITSALGENAMVRVAFLSGSVKSKARTTILNELEQGNIDIIIGTHALIEPQVKFRRLGLAIVDEQHRFGVAQRAALWQKKQSLAPHVLVMTATPIPRTLAMTIYGDLDVSVIDELPPGRMEIKTMHLNDASRNRMIAFLHNEIADGRQVYIVYPLIEESEKLDLQSLQSGYEALLQYFPPPQFQISIVHGKMKAADKEWEMQRFLKKETQIMVATTVIEVGVNVPNATVMVIENTERFGLSQLHQLRGRVGRGAKQSYCILMSDYKVSKEGKERIQTMVRTTNGFEIAEADLRQRGPGDIQGTQQSGILDFKLLNISKDAKIVETARHIAERIIEKDPELQLDAHAALKQYLHVLRQKHKDWGRIS